MPLPQSGIVARVATMRAQASIEAGVAVYDIQFREVEGVPEPAPDTLYVVSTIVLAALNPPCGPLLCPRKVNPQSVRYTGRLHRVEPVSQPAAASNSGNWRDRGHHPWRSCLPTHSEQPLYTQGYRSLPHCLDYEASQSELVTANGVGIPARVIDSCYLLVVHQQHVPPMCLL